MIVKGTLTDRAFSRAQNQWAFGQVVVQDRDEDTGLLKSWNIKVMCDPYRAMVDGAQTNLTLKYAQIPFARCFSRGKVGFEIVDGGIPRIDDFVLVYFKNGDISKPMYLPLGFTTDELFENGILQMEEMLADPDLVEISDLLEVLQIDLSPVRDAGTGDITFETFKDFLDEFKASKDYKYRMVLNQDGDNLNYTTVRIDGDDFETGDSPNVQEGHKGYVDVPFRFINAFKNLYTGIAGTDAIYNATFGTLYRVYEIIKIPILKVVKNTVEHLILDHLKFTVTKDGKFIIRFVDDAEPAIESYNSKLEVQTDGVLQQALENRVGSEEIELGDGGNTYSGTLEKHSIYPGTIFIMTTNTDGIPMYAADNNVGEFVGHATGTINYRTGEWTLIFAENVGEEVPILASYSQSIVMNMLSDKDIRGGEGLRVLMEASDGSISGRGNDLLFETLRRRDLGSEEPPTEDELKEKPGSSIELSAQNTDAEEPSKVKLQSAYIKTEGTEEEPEDKLEELNGIETSARFIPEEGDPIVGNVKMFAMKLDGTEENHFIQISTADMEDDGSEVEDLRMLLKAQDKLMRFNAKKFVMETHSETKITVDSDQIELKKGDAKVTVQGGNIILQHDARKVTINGSTVRMEHGSQSVTVSSSAIALQGFATYNGGEIAKKSDIPPP